MRPTTTLSPRAPWRESDDEKYFRPIIIDLKHTHPDRRKSFVPARSAVGCNAMRHGRRERDAVRRPFSHPMRAGHVASRRIQYKTAVW